MNQVRTYLTYLMYLALAVCFVMILWHMVMHKQWKMALLSLVCALPMFFYFVGILIALIIGWQEAANWKIKKLMIWYSLLFPLCLVVYTNNSIKEAMAPPPEVKKLKGANRAPGLQPKARSK